MIGSPSPDFVVSTLTVNSLFMFGKCIIDNADISKSFTSNNKNTPCVLTKPLGRRGCFKQSPAEFLTAVKRFDYDSEILCEFIYEGGGFFSLKVNSSSNTTISDADAIRRLESSKLFTPFGQTVLEMTSEWGLLLGEFWMSLSGDANMPPFRLPENKEQEFRGFTLESGLDNNANDDGSTGRTIWAGGSDISLPSQPGLDWSRSTWLFLYYRLYLRKHFICREWRTGRWHVWISRCFGWSSRVDEIEHNLAEAAWQEGLFG